MRPLATPIAVLSLALCISCGGDAGDASPGEPTTETGSIRFGLARVEGVDVVQTGGGPDIDYIIDSIGSGAAWLDYDLDGDADLYLAVGATQQTLDRAEPDRLLQNDGDADGDGIPSFSDVTEQAGLGDRLWSFGVATADYDNDGDADIYLTNWGPNRLYRNNGDGTFTDVAKGAGVEDPRWSAAAAWSDVDLDGDLDLYVTNYVEFSFERYAGRGELREGGTPPCMWKNIEVYCGPRKLEPAGDAFFRNDGDPDGDGVPSFTDVTRESGLDVVDQLFGLAVHFFDGDDDGDDDLYVANDSVRNSYFVNRGDGSFEEMSILSGLAYNEQGMEQAGMGIATADYDGDLTFDIAVTNFSHDHDTLYRNDGGGVFIDVSYPSGLGTASFSTLAWGIVWIDFDHDGWEDLFVGHGHVYPQVDGRDLGTTFHQPNSVFRNVGDGTLVEVSDRAGPGLEPVKGTRAVLPIDLDADGDMDLLLANMNDTPDLLINEGAAGHWLQVRLEGTRSNRDGIGALVRVEIAGRELRREIRRNVPYASTLPVAHFGLGTHDRIERLEVRWPSGEVSTMEQVKADQRLTLREP